MPNVFIPPLLRPLTQGVDSAELPGETVRQLIDRLDERFPGIREKLCADDAIRPGLVVAVDGRVSSLGLRTKVSAGSEVHFLPAIGGG